jgi:hypothetical protein
VANSAGQGATLSVTINGTNTHWQQGVTQLNFPNVVLNGIPQFTVVSPTQITANITVNTGAPAGEESITATTGGEVATGINVFTVIQTQPELLGGCLRPARFRAGPGTLLSPASSRALTPLPDARPTALRPTLARASLSIR